jgi:hypothetical protein
MNSCRLDIHYVLRDKIIRPFEELYATTGRAKASIIKYQNYFKDKRCVIEAVDGTQRFDQQLQDHIQKFDTVILSNVLGEVRAKNFAAQHVQNRKGNYVLLQAHPILCRLNLLDKIIRVEFLRLEIVSAWETLRSVLHLYNAC